MFGKEIVLSKNNTSIISKGLVLKGNLVSDGLLEVEGKINGNVKGNEITIRETGSVSGKIIANVLNIKGNFEGIIKSQKINISGKATIKGTLEYVALCVEDGASIIGDLKRMEEIILDADEDILGSSKCLSNKQDVIESKNSKEQEKKDKNKKLNKNFKKDKMTDNTSYLKDEKTEEINNIDTNNNQDITETTDNLIQDKEETKNECNI